MVSSTGLLIVEDSPEDYEATVRGFRRCGLRNPIFHCPNGESALDFLHRRGRYGNPPAAPRPGIILLDLNLPGTSGGDVLAEIKRDEGLKDIPVIVLTTSVRDEDVAFCYRAGANSYVQKPVDLPRLLEAIQRLKEYWFEISILPRRDSPE